MQGGANMADVNVEKSKERPDRDAGRRRELWPSWVGYSGVLCSSPCSRVGRGEDERERAVSSGGSRWGDGGSWSPAGDVRRQSGNLGVHADLPGMSQDDVKVEVTDEG